MAAGDNRQLKSATVTQSMGWDLESLTGLGRMAQKRAWLLERTGFELSSPFISRSVRDLVNIWILRRKIIWADSESI
jgi:hypothetical protein